ncbi:DUF2924 domain-containing protein [bacterium]|nr:DUF2924 domain-containing protein [bacterium]
MRLLRRKESLAVELAGIPDLPRKVLVECWEKAYGGPSPKGISRRLLEFSAAYQLQAKAFGGLKPTTRRKLRHMATGKKTTNAPVLQQLAKTLQPGTRLVREWHGRTYSVEVTEDNFRCDGETYKSLSQVAHAITGARWSGPRFFGL